MITAPENWKDMVHKDKNKALAKLLVDVNAQIEALEGSVDSAKAADDRIVQAERERDAAKSELKNRAAQQDKLESERDQFSANLKAELERDPVIQYVDKPIENEVVPPSFWVGALVLVALVAWLAYGVGKGAGLA